MKYILILSTVFLTLSSSLVLDYASELDLELKSAVIGIIGFALLLNVFKFYIWALIHKNFEVTKSYPLTFIFFPLIYLVAYIKGEADLSFSKIVGVFIIIMGLIVFEMKKKVFK